MKKFTKILTLLLCLVLVATAFTVVALAAEPAEPHLAHTNDFSNKDVGTSLAGSGGGKGQSIVTEADDGNRYALMSYKDGTSQARWDIQWGSKNVEDYPYLLVEFDIMTANGSYEGTSIYPRSFNTASSGFIGGLQMYFSGLGLSNEPYKWQHLSFVIEYDSASGKMKLHGYVNGEFKKTQTSSSTYANLTGKHVEFVSIYPTITATNGSQVGVDNIKATYFAEGYSLDAIADYNYKNGVGYEFPYGKTIASVIDGSGETKFDNFAEAYAFATAGTTIKLYNDVDGGVISKAITVDNTNGCAFDFTVADGYALNASNGVYTFAEAGSGAIKVVWDPDCNGSEDCDCYLGMGHVNNASAYFLDGSELAFPGEAVSSANAIVTTLLGWSYIEGATVPDTITHVDADKAVDGVITLYPVYDLANAEKYDAEVIVDGVSSFIKAEAFVATFNSLPNGATIKLHNNIAIYETLVPTYSGQTNTIDLNGFGLYRLGTNYTDYQALSDGNGGYTKGNQLATQPTAVAYGDLLKTGTHDNILNVITSRPGASIYSASVTADRLLDGDKVVGSTLTAIKFGTIFDTYGGQRNTINLTGDITTFSYMLFYCEHGASSGSSFNIDGGVHVTVGGSSGSAPTLMHVTVGGNHSIKNATIVASSYIVRHDTRSNECIVTIDNCNIIGGYMQFDSDDNGTETGKVTITNSRVSGIAGFKAFSPIVAGNVTWLDKEYEKIGILDGNEQIDASKQVTYTIPSTTNFTMNSESFLPQHTETTKSVTYTLLNTTPVDVKWMHEGETVKQESSYAGIEFPEHPEVGFNQSNDAYLDVVGYWMDSEGNPILDGQLVGFGEAEVILQSAPTSGADIKYTAGVDPMLSYNYYGKFNTIVYLPVISDVENLAVSGFTKFFDVMIDGTRYWAFTSDANNTTIGVSEDSLYTVSFNKGGAPYSDEIAVSAIRYAEALLNNSEDAVEKTAVANMVRLLKEARLATGKTADAKFDELIALGGISELGAREEYADASVDYSALAGVVSAISFKIDRTFAAYIITPQDPTATVTVTYADTDEALSLVDLGNSKLTDKTRVYDLDRAIKITVESSAGTVSGTYSVKAYIYNTDNTLAKAMYEFGMAVKAYRAAYIENQ